MHSGIRRQLGTIMIDEGFLTHEQLDHAIAEKHRCGRPLGEVLVELGFVSAEAVANALAGQQAPPLRGAAPPAPVEASGPRTPALTPDEPVLRTVLSPEELAHRRLVGELDSLLDQCRALNRGAAQLESELERLRDSV